MATFFPTDYTRSFLASRGVDGTLVNSQLALGGYIDTGSNAAYAAELRDLYVSAGALVERAGVQVVNAIANPRLVNDTNSWTSSSTAGFVSSSYTRTQAWSPSLPVGGSSLRMQGVAPNDSTSRTLAYITPTGTAGVPTAPSVPWTASFYYRIDSRGNSGLRILFTWYDAAGATLSNATGSTTLVTGTEGRYVFTATADASAAFVAIRTQFVNSSANSVLDAYVGGWMLTQGSTTYGFFSGDTPQGVWLGTPNASSSYVML